MPSVLEPPFGKLVVGAWAVVHLVDGSVHRGVVYTVDPEAFHVVLLRPPADSTAADTCDVSPLVLPASSIDSITQEHDAVDMLGGEAVLRRIAGSVEHDFDSDAIERRRVAVCALLRSQRAPFEEMPSGDLLILGCLHLGPPYTAAACRCENEIVLGRFVDNVLSLIDV